MPLLPIITTASVRVMRSHDYNHFEVTLGSNVDQSVITIHEVDELRKAAARLADKAVLQYRISKASAQSAESAIRDREYYRIRLQQFLTVPEGERTPEQKAEIKESQDRAYRLRRAYDYEDDWQDDEGDMD